MKNTLMSFSTKPIVSQFNGVTLQIFSDTDCNLCAVVGNKREVIIPFKDDGDVDEITCIVGYEQVAQNIFKLYNQKFYYKNNILCEGGVELHSCRFLIILGNNIKLTSSKVTIEKMLNKILI